MPRARILQPFHVDIESRPGKIEHVTFCGKSIAKAGAAPLTVMEPHLQELLRWQSRVPDAWRYCFTIKNGRVSGNWEAALGGCKIARSDFADDAYMHEYLGGLNIILLVLESPHVSEFAVHGSPPVLIPKAPAQGRKPGDAGGAIEKYGLDVLDLLLQQHSHRFVQPFPDGQYSLVLVNPVPYLTSLHWMDVLTGHAKAPSGKLKHSVRNHVWLRLWHVPTVQEDFTRRCKQYAPVAILNCCTAKLKDEVTSSLRDVGFANITYCAFHPALNWKNGISNVKRPIKVTPAIS